MSYKISIESYQDTKICFLFFHSRPLQSNLLLQDFKGVDIAFMKI